VTVAALHRVVRVAHVRPSSTSITGRLSLRSGRRAASSRRSSRRSARGPRGCGSFRLGAEPARAASSSSTLQNNPAQIAGFLLARNRVADGATGQANPCETPGERATRS
jgi:hypothetical protein